LNTVKPLEIKTPTIIEINKTEASPIPQPKIVDFRKTTEAERRYIYINYILFPVGKSNINPKYIPLLNDLCKIILSNDQIGIEINGYADPTGNEEKNLDLSRKRAEEVEKYLISKNIPVRRIISEGKGEIEDNKEIDYSQARRAEIKLFEIIKK
jgi:outer membrane protein OmpA-like peptidoglycan-associated protein